MSIKWMIVACLVVAVVSSGCGKRRSRANPEAEETVAEADTATIDTEASAESLPALDEGTGNNVNPTVTADSSNVPQDSATPSRKKGKRKKGNDLSSGSFDAPPAVSGTGEMGSYTVQRGDTLMKIAYNLYGDIGQWKMLYDLNKEVLKNANALDSGIALKYDKPSSQPNLEKNGDPYMIKKGDTLGTIADDIYAKRSKWKDLWNNNRSLIRDPNKIYAGFYLYYQITEEERQQAEQIKMNRGGQRLGSAGDGGLKVGKGALKAGGLDSLADPTSVAEPTRVPANTRRN